MQKKFYSSHWFLKNQIFSLLPIVKMNANYAEICWVNNLNSAKKKVKDIFLFSQTKIEKKNHFTIEIA